MKPVLFFLGGGGRVVKAEKWPENGVEEEKRGGGRESIYCPSLPLTSHTPVI